MSKKFTTALCMLPMLVLSTLSLSAQTTRGLSFTTASSDYATAIAGTPIVPTIGFDATIELWAYVPVAEAGPHYFLSQGTALNAFYIGYDHNQSDLITLGDQWLGTGNVTLPIGQWNHIALVYDGNNFNAKLYLNGVAVDSVIDGSFYTCGSGTQFQLGTDVDNSIYSTFKMTQVRVWNVQRTAAEIKAGMYGSVSPSDPNLIAYYSLNEASGPTAANSQPATTGADLSIMNSTAHVFVPIQTANNALLFDGTNFSQVDIKPHAEYDIATGSVEAWVKPGSLTGDATILANNDAGGSRYTFSLDNGSGNKRIGIKTTADGTHYINYAAGFTANNWYHIALVSDHAASGDTTALYVNGNYIGNIPYGYDNSIVGQALHIGGDGIDLTHQWQGSIDEVRVWGVPITQSQIISNMGISLTGSEANLVSVWSFDQGVPDQDNTGLKVAVDNAPLTSNGTLSNFDLSSASPSNFTLHNIILPVTFGKFTVSKQGNSALLQWQTLLEQNTKDFIIERSGNGTDFTDIGSTPASGDSHGAITYAFTDNDPLEGKNFYRLKERDLDLKAIYSEVKILSFTRTGSLIWYATDAGSVEVRLQKGSTELYSVSDVAGHIIQKGRLSDGKTTLSQLTSGVYFVKVVNTIGDELMTKVLIK
jgi:hypothetical protein